MGALLILIVGSKKPERIFLCYTGGGIATDRESGISFGWYYLAANEPLKISPEI